MNRMSSCRKGIALIVAMLFLAIFAAFAVALAAMSTANVETAQNQRTANSALVCAESGIEYAKYLVSDFVASGKLPKTSQNTVSDTEADSAWTEFCKYLRSINHGGHALMGCTHVCNGVGNGHKIYTDWINYGSSGSFSTRFYRMDGDSHSVYMEATGIDGQATRVITLKFTIMKDAKVLQYAIATRSRMWITGDSTIHGDVYSAWNLSKTQLSQLSTNPEKLATWTAPSISPFNVTGDSAVLGTINSCWSTDQVSPKSWQFETLAHETYDTQGRPLSDGFGTPVMNAQNEYVKDSQGNYVYSNNGTYYVHNNAPEQYQSMDQLLRVDSEGQPMYVADGSGNFLLTDAGDMIRARVVTADDEIQGACTGIDYGVPPQDLAGMDISDYDTSSYSATAATTIAASTTTSTEYFPHGVNTDGTNNYKKSVSGSISLTRNVYTNQTYDNAKLPASRNALFKNCTFNGVLYVDCSKTGSSFNNVRFENCTFNGTIVTNTPTAFNWQKNMLYFTGSATFQNSTSSEATILAPHFNVNLGNANPVAGTNNVLKGAIVGGIVDVRGNAEVFGTIISMADTSSYTSGYVTNIGATVNDGGSETVAVGDVGTINIRPDQNKLLPSGITSPIVIRPDQTSYAEQM